MNCAWFQVPQQNKDMPDLKLFCQTTIAALLSTLFFLPNPIQANEGETQLPSGFVYLANVAPTILQDMRYATRNNFTGKVLPGYKARQCVLRRDVASALHKVQAAAMAKGYSLKVYDCYRPARAVRAFGVWAANHKDLSTKDYYPRLPKSQLFGKGYIAKRSTHSIGAAIDLTLVRMPAVLQPVFDPATARKACTSAHIERAPDNSVDMGSGFDCFDRLSHTNSPAINPQARQNRQLLRTLMGQQGFANYSAEWWHYSYKMRSYPRIYRDFPILPIAKTR